MKFLQKAKSPSLRCAPGHEPKAIEYDLHEGGLVLVAIGNGQDAPASGSQRLYMIDKLTPNVMRLVRPHEPSFNPIVVVLEDGFIPLSIEYAPIGRVDNDPNREFRRLQFSWRPNKSSIEKYGKPIW